LKLSRQLLKTLFFSAQANVGKYFVQIFQTVQQLVSQVTVLSIGLHASELLRPLVACRALLMQGLPLILVR
jgi:hypothetical protein